MVGGGLGLHAGAARAGDREERRSDVEPRPRERIERELRRGGEAAGRRDAPGAPKLGAERRRPDRSGTG